MTQGIKLFESAEKHCKVRTKSQKWKNSIQSCLALHHHDNCPLDLEEQHIGLHWTLAAICRVCFKALAPSGYFYVMMPESTYEHLLWHAEHMDGFEESVLHWGRRRPTGAVSSRQLFVVQRIALVDCVLILHLRSFTDAPVSANVEVQDIQP